jgi:hypothetical protein
MRISSMVPTKFGTDQIVDFSYNDTHFAFYYPA